mmetsp:Transcript_21548/g.61367  ORF Transcript_21548/g.61367 Transcript_21548/m.61367 type:complete len:210 (-) Transcript_21548:193-822(-)
MRPISMVMGVNVRWKGRSMTLYPLSCRNWSKFLNLGSSFFSPSTPPPPPPPCGGWLPPDPTLSCRDAGALAPPSCLPASEAPPPPVLDASLGGSGGRSSIFILAAGAMASPRISTLAPPVTLSQRRSPCRTPACVRDASSAAVMGWVSCWLVCSSCCAGSMWQCSAIFCRSVPTVSVALRVSRTLPPGELTRRTMSDIGQGALLSLLCC